MPVKTLGPLNLLRETHLQIPFIPEPCDLINGNQELFLIIASCIDDPSGSILGKMLQDLPVILCKKEAAEYVHSRLVINGQGAQQLLIKKNGDGYCGLIRIFSL